MNNLRYNRRLLAGFLPNPEGVEYLIYIMVLLRHILPYCHCSPLCFYGWKYPGGNGRWANKDKGYSKDKEFRMQGGICRKNQKTIPGDGEIASGLYQRNG